MAKDVEKPTPEELIVGLLNTAGKERAIIMLREMGLDGGEIILWLLEQGVDETTANRLVAIYYSVYDSKPIGGETYSFGTLGPTKEAQLIGPSQKLTAWGAITEFMDNILDNFLETQVTMERIEAAEQVSGINDNWNLPTKLEVDIGISKEMVDDADGGEPIPVWTIKIIENSGGIRTEAFDALCRPGKSFHGTNRKSVSVWGVGTKYALCALGRNNIIRTYHYRSNKGTELIWDRAWYESQEQEDVWEPGCEHFGDRGDFVGKTCYTLSDLTPKGNLLGMNNMELAGADAFTDEFQMRLGFGEPNQQGVPCNGPDLLHRWLSLVLGLKITQVRENTGKEVSINIQSEFGTLKVESTLNFTGENFEWNKAGCMVGSDGNINDSSLLMNFPGYEPLFLSKTVEVNADVRNNEGHILPKSYPLTTKIVVGLMPETSIDNEFGAGYYMWGNGRLFDKAERSLFSGVSRYRKFKIQNARMMVLVFFECDAAKLIPWTHGTKWGFSSERLPKELTHFLRNIPQTYHAFAERLNAVTQYGVLDPWKETGGVAEREARKNRFEDWGWLDGIGTFDSPIDPDDETTHTEQYKNRFGGRNVHGLDQGAHYRDIVNGLVDNLSNETEALSADDFFEILMPTDERIGELFEIWETAEAVDEDAVVQGENSVEGGAS